MVTLVIQSNSDVIFSKIQEGYGRSLRYQVHKRLIHKHAVDVILANNLCVCFCVFARVHTHACA